MLTLFYNVHQLIVVTLDGGLKWSYIVIQTGGFDVSDHLVYNADHLFVIPYIWQYLNCYTCVHFHFLLSWFVFLSNK